MPIPQTAKTWSRILPLALAAITGFSALACPARAASISKSPTAPATGVDDIANYGSVTVTDKWFYENSAAGAAKGQTFTTGNAAVLLKSITYQIAAGAGAAPTKTYAIRVGTVAGSTPTFTQIVRETASQSVAWAAGDYVTWTFATPILLQSNTAYGIDVGMIGSTSGRQTGIPYLNVTGNVYSGGVLYNSGTLGAGTAAMSLCTSDRLFHLDLEKPITPAFTLVATNPADGAVNVLASNPLSATFSRYLTLGTGNIIFRNLTDSVDTRGAAVLKVQLTNDLGLADLWTSHEAVVPDANGTVNGVVFDTIADADPALIIVRAEIPGTGKVFGRILSTGN